MPATGFSSVPQFVANPSLNPSLVKASGWSTETFTVNGLTASMVPLVHAPSLEAGVALVSARITAANTLELTFANKTNADIDPAAQTFNVYGL